MKKTYFKILFPLLILTLILAFSACEKDAPFNGKNEELGLELTGGGFDGKCTLVASRVTESINVSEVKSKLVGQEYNDTAELFIYYVKVVRKGAPVSQLGNVTVSISEPTADYGDYTVFNITESNVEKLAFTLADGKITFEASSLSYFVIAHSHVHVYSEWSAAEDGENHVRSCSCGYVATEAHTYDNGIKLNNKTTKYTCTVCGYVHNHDHAFIKYTNASDGHNHTKTCACGDSIPEDHVFDQGIPSQNGILYTCTLCGHINIQTKVTIKITITPNNTAVSYIKINGVEYTEPIQLEYGTKVTVEVKAATGYTFNSLRCPDELTKNTTYVFTVGEADFTKGKQEIELQADLTEKKDDSSLGDLPIL